MEYGLAVGYGDFNTLLQTNNQFKKFLTCYLVGEKDKTDSAFTETNNNAEK